MTEPGAKKPNMIGVDIRELMLKYVRTFPLTKEVKAKVNLDELEVSDVDTSHLVMYNLPTQHTPSSDDSFLGIDGGVQGFHMNGPSLENKIPEKVKKGVKNNVIFTSVFTNNTSEPQTNHLRTERRTTSICRIAIHKSVTKSGNLSLQIGPPNTAIQANGGFSRELTLSREGENVFEEDLTWSLDSEIVVPAGYRTRAELVITEEEYDGQFRVETIFEGNVSVNLRDKKGDGVVSTVFIADLAKALRPEHGFHTVKGRPNAVSFVSEGACHCNYGIGQSVQLHQERL